MNNRENNLAAKIRKIYAREKKSVLRKAFRAVLARDKIKTIEDACDLYVGLSGEAKRLAAICYIYMVARLGRFKPSEILKQLEHGTEQKGTRRWQKTSVKNVYRHM